MPPRVTPQELYVPALPACQLAMGTGPACSGFSHAQSAAAAAMGRRILRFLMPCVTGLEMRYVQPSAAPPRPARRVPGTRAASARADPGLRGEVRLRVG